MEDWILRCPEVPQKGCPYGRMIGGIEWKNKRDKLQEE